MKRALLDVKIAMIRTYSMYLLEWLSTYISMDHTAFCGVPVGTVPTTYCTVCRSVGGAVGT